MPKRILLIDDEDGARRIIQFSLEAAAGWEVLTAASGAEGLNLAEAEPFDAILLDVMMPDLDGAATFQRLQENPETRSIPVIMLTAKANPAEHQPLVELGIAGIITKPFKIPALIAQIRAILNWQE
ncbi:response regulator [Oculatella sp. FACHB-28]|uniref:response regulator n=1 Tax=Cyanophyceae TaxID=3028117 RepID=UPI0016860887|nr:MULTISPECIES: response regulator [Cyanophyceae]MBD1870671.1 response regulator [Cyanobacteria bacterium FACHB-471]MBD2001547.1 response regulator [Leptolyngbya sp. FACHB-541]MBD2057567.1 response regulator [Oculatella sp. FACHB-28]MBD2070124.1 response regulator [Leptolyngbya sp. FACHB-671]